MEPKHHVIFLGAGASFTSGYPVGDSLRLRLSCSKRFSEDLGKGLGKLPVSFDFVAHANTHLNAFKESMRLFRNGGFATVDEFSRLASKDYPKHTQEMKKLMRLAFSFHNPEDEFHESDYYGFIQRLFQPHDLHSLRNEITVLSYNYDCYLDYLLLRAYAHRQQLAGAGALSDHWKNKLTSGFHKPEDLAWAEEQQGFHYYKLHGSIFGNTDYSHLMFFEKDSTERLKTLGDEFHTKSIPPIVFPWELFDGEGKIIGQNDFIFVKDALPQNKAFGTTLHTLYRKIWEGAREAVRRAHKISFVGLSLHPYMLTGLQYLFKGKQGTVEAIVANPENKEFKESKNRLHPASLCGRIAETFVKVAPGMKYIKSFSEDDGMVTMEKFDAAKIAQWEPDITARFSFREFIQTEMA